MVHNPRIHSFYREEDQAILTTPAVVMTVDDSTPELARQMYKMARENNGVGLAAPQIGIGARLFVITPEEEQNRCFVNPRIIEVDDELIIHEEGCLSLHGVYAKVKRPASLKVEAQDEYGRDFALNADGFLATIIQHEYDHLDGVLFIDHLPPLRRKRIMRKVMALHQTREL